MASMITTTGGGGGGVWRSATTTTTKTRIPTLSWGPRKAAVVECSSRPQKKATAHHRKTRPKKTQPWDVKRRGPTPYPPLPALPPDWTLLVPSSEKADDSEEEEEKKEQEEEEALLIASAAT